MNEIKVKHANELNRIPMRGFTATEMDLFFSLCAKMKDKGTQKYDLTLKRYESLVIISLQLQNVLQMI